MKKVGKVKVFLAAFINQTNAQNINCRELAKNLDEDEFDVYTLELSSGNLSSLTKKNVHIFRCWYPTKVSGLIGYLWGFLKSEVVYLPRADFLWFQKCLIKIFRKKSFKTMENIIDVISIDTAFGVFGGDLNKIISYYKYADRNYPISKYVGDYNYKHYSIKYNQPILYVPTDFDSFYIKRDVNDILLTDIVFIGNDFRRKRLSKYLELAQLFPDLKFHVVGKGNLPDEIHEIKNVKYHGMLSHEALHNLLESIQLHYFPSLSEGFGKVTIEVGAAGIPTILHGNYGAAEWINNEKEGIIVSEFDEVVEKVRLLKNNTEFLAKLSQGAQEMSRRFDSRRVVKIYEQVIKDLIN
ncbi:glycosyltransferase family 4 protein [Fulvivirga sediminis]|uniref:Glycosyltransferase family 4 protein n=1 Tax=Fulvivirga sediminis TaxID=2803949 RepID=A0A937F312_9BACT|nr:glycosyltransferase family 4 protein [Fulvivirga sediminis]MBL3655386.1 glycosyltransferase family 4 protein [Fulvivirga sediminis]